MSACTLPRPVTLSLVSAVQRRMSALPNMPVAPKIRIRILSIMRFLYSHRLRAARALGIESCGDSMNGCCKPDRRKHCRLAHSLLADHPFLLMMESGSARCDPRAPRRATNLGFADPNNRNRDGSLIALFLPELRQGRSDQGSLLCSTQPRSLSRTPASSRYTHRLLRLLGAGSSNQRGDRRACRST